MNENENGLYIPEILQIRTKRFLSPDNNFRAKILHYAQDMPTHKTFYQISHGETFPSPIDDAVAIVESAFERHDYYDSVILKRYEHESEAYVEHHDPDEYDDREKVWNGSMPSQDARRMTLWNFTNSAIFTTYTDGNWLTPWRWETDMARELPAHIGHKVSRPQEEDVPRIVLWFGQSNRWKREAIQTK